MEISLTDFVLFGLLEDVDPMQALNALLEFLVVTHMVVENLVDLVLELLLVLFLLADLSDCLSLFFLHAFSLQLHVFDDEAKVLVDNEEVFRLVIHLCLLLLEALDDFHTGSNTRLQFFDLVIEHEFELLKLLRLSAILVDLRLLISDSTLSLLQLVFHAFDMLLFAVGVGNFGIQILVLLFDLLVEVVLLLFFVAELVANQSQLTLLLHTFVDFHAKLLLVLFFLPFNEFPGLIFDLLAIFFVSFDHLLDLQRQCLLLSLKFFPLKDLITIETFHQALMGEVSLSHEHFKLL